MRSNPLERYDPNVRGRNNRRRQGKVLVLVAGMMTLLLGMVALGVDLGLIKMTKTQLQASSDSGSLAAGTELISGLGAGAFRTSDEVVEAGQEIAVEYVALHPAAEAQSTHIQGDRDVRFGRALMNPVTGVWTFEWGETPYNAVGVTTQRSNVGTTEGDRPLPLIFARALGHHFSDVTADSVTVIMPASAIHLPPGSGASSGLSPFAFSAEVWEKYRRARAYWNSNGLTQDDLSMANGGHEIPDPEDLDENGLPLPLFYEKIIKNKNQTDYRQLFGDQYGMIDPLREDTANIIEAQDGVLEMNIFPLNNEAGNFGTVNIGNNSNSTQVLKSQIENGLTEEEMERQFEGGMFDPSGDEPLELTGDTGISAGIEASLESIVGQKRLIVLYSKVENPGNNAIYTIVDIVAIRIMAVKLSGGNKVLVIQPDSMSDPGGVPNFDEEITDETTFFTPLMLAR